MTWARGVTRGTLNGGDTAAAHGHGASRVGKEEQREVWHGLRAPDHCQRDLHREDGGGGSESHTPPPPCVTESVGVPFLYGALDSHPFVPSLRRVAAAGALAGVVAVFAEPCRWCAGGCAGGGGMCRLCVSGAQLLAYRGLCWLLPGSFDCFCCPHTTVLRPSTTCLAVFPCASGPGALLLHALSRPSTTSAPPLRGSRVRRARSSSVAGSVRFVGDVGGVRACTVSRVLYAAL